MIVMAPQAPCEHWQPQPEFSMTRFRPKCIDYAITSADVERKVTTKPFAEWLAAVPYRKRSSARCSNWGSAASPWFPTPDFEKFRRYAQALHKRMAADSKASPVALAIAGAIANYAVGSRRSLVVPEASWRKRRDIRCAIFSWVWPVALSVVFR